MATMIFHVPYPLDPSASTASGLRPARMRRAFGEAGLEVIEIAGPAAARARQIRAAKAAIRNGRHVDFVYSESSTLPTALTEPHHLPVRPTLDLAFLAWCRRRAIPVGLFYRDVYWRFPEYLDAVPRPLSWGTRALYRADLLAYERVCTKLFLPSLAMGAHLPSVRKDRLHPLPPGCDIGGSATIPADHLRLVYAGGIGPYYRMVETVAGVAASGSATMTLCAPQAQWRAAREEYEPALAGRTEVVHGSGTVLDGLYQRSDLASLHVEPSSYRSFAAPFKLYEYLGRGLPVIASAGTSAGRFVADTGIGWALPYDRAAVTALLDRLADQPAELAAMRSAAWRVRQDHTWRARAEEVARVLTGGPT